MKFNVGDNIIVTADFLHPEYINKKGVITEIHPEEEQYYGFLYRVTFNSGEKRDYWSKEMKILTKLEQIL